MLSKLLLRFAEREQQSSYDLERRNFYSRRVPIMTVLVFLLSLVVELCYRLEWFESGLFAMHTSIINWVAVLVMLGLCFAVRKFTPATWLICPILTALTIYYFLAVDYDGTLVTIFMTSMIGLMSSFFFNVIFSEVWFVSSAVYTPLLVYYLYHISLTFATDLKLEISTVDITLISIFGCFTYTGVAYQVERMRKESFVGREHFEKSFNRWLKVFETFPEGIAMIRNDGEHIQYANSSLRKLLDLEPVTDSTISSVGSLKTQLEQTRIRPYQNERQANTLSSAQRQRESSVWDFLSKNDRGATYELRSTVTPTPARSNSLFSQLPEGRKSDAKESDQPPQGTITSGRPSNQQQNAGSGSTSSGGSQKFVALNQVTVNIAGRTEKLFIVRDVTHTIYLDHLIQTKEHMQEFTQSMMENIDESMKFTQETFKTLEPYVQPGARQFIDDVASEMKKSRYSIRDYQIVYDISENDFFEPPHRRVDIRACLREVVNAAANDIQKSEVEVIQEVQEGTSQLIAADQDLFIQVMINLLLQTVNGLSSAGFIKINCQEKIINAVPHLVIDLVTSEFMPDKQQAVNIRNMTNEKDFRKIMSADTDMYIKIAKTLSNHLGWKIEFNWVQEGRYSLQIPLIHALSDPDFEEPPEIEEETKANYNSRTPLIAGRPVFSKQSNRDRLISYEQLDSDDKDRPFSAQVPELGGTRMKMGFRPVQEVPELENNDQNGSPQASTKSFRFRDCCAVCLLMNSTDIKLFEDNLGMKCDEAFLEKEALTKIQKSLGGCRKQGCSPYKYFVIDLDETSRKTNLKWLIPQVKELLAKANTSMRVVAIATVNNQVYAADCKALGIQYVIKPKSIEALKIILKDNDQGSRVQTTNVETQQETRQSPSH